MKIVVFGASRGVGRCLVERALAEGHWVTAAVRDPAVSMGKHERLRIERCDLLEPASVMQAMAGQEVAFGTFGTDSWGSTTLYSAGARAIVQGIREHGVRRLVFLSNFGVIGERAHGPSQAAILLLSRWLLRHTLADHRRALDVIRELASEWVAVRPLALTNGAGTGQYRISVDGLPPAGTRIARADVADFMLRRATGDDYLYEAPAIAY